ncbi:MAG: DUF4136 domain-containing protein [Tannerella sp.]|jgi:hypothetical protein|nr:DUF4136 domain-containing protein [Tannerella sp.]
MKRIFFIITVLCWSVTTKAQDVSCRYGFSYEISNDPHWGKDKPVITSIYPDSPAEKAGIKPYDIIEEVEGTPVTENVLDDIYLFLNPEGKEIVTLTIKNISEGSHKVKIKKECKNIYSLAEEQLATAFAMYAVEYTHERLFSCPFITAQTKDPVDFAAFKSFDFFGQNQNQPELAKKINELIKKELMNRGLKYDPVNPDLLVQIYYSFNKNPNYKPRATSKKSTNDKKEEYGGVYRYDVTRDRMAKLPFLPPGTIETEAEYILKLGFRLEDRKQEKGRIIWECEANELLNESYSPEDFAFIHIPLMSMQYPYMKYGRNVQYRLSKKKYNYTGINYNIENISEVASVDPYSPAAKAGIKPFDRIDAIENKRMEDRTSQQFTSAYRQFLVNTLKLRNKETRFVDANGFPDCMYWDEVKYPQVVKAFNNKKNLTAFSYLFQYAPFINPSGNNTCSFKLRRNKEKLEYIVRPEIRSEVTVVVE